MQIEIQDFTIDRMYEAIKVNYKPDDRHYLGASEIGHDCARQLYYNYNDYAKEPHDAKTIMIFEGGHRAEDLAAKRLSLIPGIQLITRDENGEQFGFSDMNGKHQGHYDGQILGIAEAPKTWHIWEHKEIAEKKFEAFLKKRNEYGYKNILKHWNSVYYAQAQEYMHYAKLKRHFMTISTMGGRRYTSCRTDYNKLEAEDYIRKAEMIIKAQRPPQRLSEDPEYYQCRWCDFKGTCHG